VSPGFYRMAGKRLIDIVFATAALVVLSPLLVAVAAGVWLGDRGTPLFRQQRIGRDGVPFTLLKFRSMPVGSVNVPKTDGARIQVTRVGRFLRRSNIDELPQLVNILAGQMSIVGPRPALPAQEGLIALRRASGALSCAPGLTGLAQVNSHDGMSVEAKAEWDARYAAAITLTGDLRIICRTFGYLLRPPPIY
jgi:lipopolysaccharide/colanic/teichoic acid biosynthesis glycosyltransferase